MKLDVAIFLTGLCAIGCTTATGGTEYKYKFDHQKLGYQKDILTLFKRVNQPSYYKEHVQIAKSFSIEANVKAYTKPEVVERFLLYQYGFLHKEVIFSIFQKDHLDQAIALFKLFYYAKNFQTFYHTAIWARENLNAGLFLYSFSVAVVHRPDTYGIVLPPIYEISPNYFFNSKVIHKVYYYNKTYHESQKHVKVESYKIWANYSGNNLNLPSEQSMSYYTEDVGINSFYYYFNIYYPFWMSGEEFHLKFDNRGEQYYFIYQQILARYYLERLSNRLGKIENFDWDLPFETPYYPSMVYYNGAIFPVRPPITNLKTRYTNKVHTFENRIYDAIGKGYVNTRDGQKVVLSTKEGINVLGNLIESNPESPDSEYYEDIQLLARHLLGCRDESSDQHKSVPSALEHFETSMRDPAFYQLYKKIISYFQRYKSYLNTYTKHELYFPGVKVFNVNFDRLITYFNFFDSDLSNALYVTPAEYKRDPFQIYVHQNRLNHKPFNYKIHVISDKAAKAVVKVFLGPKNDELKRYIKTTKNHMNFVQFDHFLYDLKSGENLITRNSNESYFYGPDRTSYKHLYKSVIGAYSGNQEFSYDWRKSYFYFPQRYMLPKGSYNGTTYQFFVIVYPYVPYKGQTKPTGEVFQPKFGTGNQYVDGYALGYPFDRSIQDETLWQQIPNSYFYETKIYHQN